MRPALLAIACAAATAEASRQLREAFNRRRCLPAEREAMFPFGGEQKWVLEVNSWTSHRVVTTIAAILLREHVGYSVDLNPVASPSRAYERVAKLWAEEEENGDAVEELLSSGAPFGYANMEVWPSGRREQYREFVAGRRQVVDAGPVGYEGRSGWFVPQSLAMDPSFPVSPEFYRAYNASQPESQMLLDALRQCNAVNCSNEGVCCCGSAATCQGASAFHWCRTKSDGVLPAVLSLDPQQDLGYNEELARSHGLRFALSYLGEEAFARDATAALAPGGAQVVHTWRPSTFLSRLRLRGVPISRIMFPSERCGKHLANGSGDWSCEFPQHELGKLASAEIKRDPVARHFFTRFTVPDAQEGGSHGLAGGGILELMEALVARKNGTEPVEAEEIFDVACEWLLSNELEGAEWGSWVGYRKVPFFADTLMGSYPFPALLALFVVALSCVLFMEIPWLQTTLSPQSVRKIMEKNKDVHWRTGLEVRLRKTVVDASPPVVPHDPSERFSDAQVGVQGLPYRYWEGLAERSVSTDHLRDFWGKTAEWCEQAKLRQQPPEEAPPELADRVRFAHYCFPCLESSEQAAVHLVRSPEGAASGRRLVVKLVVQESGGGAAKDRDFLAEEREVTFAEGSERAVVFLPVVHHNDKWMNCRWFEVRLAGVLAGEGGLAAPSRATIVILKDDRWPGNLPDSKRGNEGLSLMRYFVYADRIRRGEKWWKTMLAMVWLPVHSVFVSTLVQKVLVDHAAQHILMAPPEDDVDWFYWECVLLVCVQLLSLALLRWADVVQTRNRGRTGGIRQHHRSEILRKFMLLEHSDHWEATDAHWLYSAIYDADVITGQAYFQVFVLAQSCFALFLSFTLVLGLAVWSQISRSSVDDSTGPLQGSLQALWYVSGIFLMIPLSLIGLWTRRRLTWVVVISRKAGETAWFKSCTWIIMSWRQFHGLLWRELATLEKRVLRQNAAFVPAHWDARDTMNDTAWITHWIQGIAYCSMLLFGTFALIEYQTYGLGAMEVGTFYALCKIFLSVGKYIGRLSSVFVSMQRAVVSLREIAALLNQRDQHSLRREALMWLNPNAQYELASSKSNAIHMEPGLCFLRPPDNKVGFTFAELRLKTGCLLPLGRTVHVSARNERLLRSFIGLACEAIHPTGPCGQELPPDAPRVVVPKGLRLLMIPTVPVAMGTTAPSVLEQLEFTGAPRDLCIALAECVGLEPGRETASLGPGSAQVFSIVRALLVDPDVLGAFRPLALVPDDVRDQMANLLRLWQGGGGVPKIAEFLGVPLQGDDKVPVYRPSTRTLIIGNSTSIFSSAVPSDAFVDLDGLLWKGVEPSCAEAKVPTKSSTKICVPSCLKGLA